ncbi:preprotein translocase subunit SecA [Thermasporomyces composti]|uniref:Protein translocase subunit SecA n=1 Tax=Thermasporomyces composti TaxID=696763 RepID=A0A3D9VH81_THECX|nr:preprotein translocase subunit SecA [Thermasporomyces composti]REF37544.1 protein translocase subunit secA [Thermasporomyces composti]
MPALLDKILRAGEGKTLKKLQAIARQVNAIEEHFTSMTDEELRDMTQEFRARYADGESLDDLLPEAFATVREAAKRTILQRHFDVQIMGGAALHMGHIAEMKTGEGKTLVATLAAYLNAIAGKGVHVVTVNDYLAQYQGEWMGRIYHFLGMSVGVIRSDSSIPERRKAYACDITYGTNNEFGFDYLRDNMAMSLDGCVQRGHHYAIVDEVDSILIDEARTPLIISGTVAQSSKWYEEFARIAARLRPDVDYEVDLKKRTVGILEPGIDKVEDYLGIDNLYEPANTPLVQYLNNAIRAKELFKRDRDYVVLDGEVLIVDEHTGRILHGRRYNEGLHQAIEAKEGVPIRDENQTFASITLQNYFRLYEKLAGMTGTAMTEAAEFNKIYNLQVTPIPTNRPMIRIDQPDLVFRTKEAKFAAVVNDIAERHAKGQPVLVGTTSVEQSELLSSLLKKRGIPHEVLNAKNHAREAAIVAQAGRKGAVTVATNMAGRGTDIMLGGNPEFLADQELREMGLDPVEHAEEYERAWPAVLERCKKAVAAEHDEVAALGGLYVLGTERHESRRIDNQLRGRAGRQGDPGESRFYLSLEDDLMRRFKSDWVDWVLTSLKIPDDVPIENKRVTGAIASAQAQVEAMNFELRKDILKYDDVLNKQREVIYAERRRVLEGQDIHEQVKSMIDDVLESYVYVATEGPPEDWDLERLWADLKTVYPVGFSVAHAEAEVGGRSHLTREDLLRRFREDAHRAYERREAELGSDVLRDLERQVILRVLDDKWRDHLYEMDYLREGIGLRAMAQRDPLVEYQREGYDLFMAMMDAIKEESVRQLFYAQVQFVPATIPGAAPAGVPASAAAGAQGAAAQPEGAPAPPPVQERPRVVVPGLGGPQLSRLSYSGPSVDGAGGVVQRTERPGTGIGGQTAAQGADGDYSGTPRNAPCPCGSGRKFKRCHGDPKARARMSG